AGTAVALDRTFLEIHHFDPLKHLPCGQVADFKTEQAVDVDIATGLRRVDRKRANGGAERSNGLYHLLSCRVHNREEGRLQTGAVDSRSVQTTNGVVGAALRFDFGGNSAGGAVDDVPVGTFKGWHIEPAAIRRDRHPVAAAG